MNRYYRRTFDKVRLSESRQEQIRSTLSSQYNTYQEEAGLMNSKTCALKPKHSRVLVVVAAIVMVMVFVGFTYGSRIIQLLGGGRLEEGRDSKGNNYSSMDTGFASDPVEVRDGQIYFILDGSDTNITDQCSEENFYRYESVDGNGYRHVVLIGGTPENIGMAEFVWDESGAFRGSNASYKSPEEPKWLISGRSALGLD